MGAVYNGHQFRLYVDGFDANVSALYSVSVTSTGKVLIRPRRTTTAPGMTAS
jgi:hypothetical protein